MVARLIQLINDDCYKAIKDIPDKSIDLVYIDVPYLFEQGGDSKTALDQRIAKKKQDIRLSNNETKLAKYKEKEQEYRQKMATAKTQSEYEKWHSQNSNVLKKINYLGIDNGFDLGILDELVRVMKNIYIYIWCSKEQIYPLMKYFVEDKKCRSNILCWCKTNPTPSTNNSWLPDVEYCLVFKDSNAPKYNDGYQLKSKWYVSAANKRDKDMWDHPTIKPLELVKRHIEHSTNPGDTVLDCFMGSGTTGVACKMLNRNFIGIEINDKYFEIADKRINESRTIKEKEQFSLFEED